MAAFAANNYTFGRAEAFTGTEIKKSNKMTVETEWCTQKPIAAATTDMLMTSKLIDRNVKMTL